MNTDKIGGGESFFTTETRRCRERSTARRGIGALGDGAGGAEWGNDFGGSHALRAEGAEGEGVVAFGEALAAVVEHERGVVVGGGDVAEGADEEELPKGGADEIGAADDFGDAELGVVDGAGELVTGGVVFAPDEEVAEVATGDGALRAEVGVMERNGFAVGDAEAPVHGDDGAERWQGCVEGRAELRWVKGFVVGGGRGGGFVRGGDGFEDIAARAGAGEDEAGGVECGEGGAVMGQPGALRDDGFAPREAEPAEVCEHGGDEIEAEAEGVEVIVAEEEFATGGAGAFGSEPKCACVAEVEMARRRGGEAAEVGERIFNHG